MIDWLPYQIQTRYPHMAEADTIIWSRYVQRYPKSFEAVAYDVPVGEGAAFDTVVNPATGGDIKKLYQRRIDVLALKDGQYYVIEVKPRASTAAIGQVKGYIKLLARDQPEYASARALIITDSLMPEMEFLTRDEGVAIVVV